MEMSWQELLRKKSIASLETLAERFGPEHVADIERLKQAAENFEFRISPAMVDLIREPGDPIWLQYVPTVQELEIEDGIVDSLAEDAHSPVPNITHRYPDRALFLVSPVCASYCRFCTRRRKVGDPEKIPMAQLESAFRYLAEHTEIRDVIMSGETRCCSPTAGSTRSARGCAPFRTLRSSASGAGCPVTSRSASPRSCAGYSGNTIRSTSTRTSIIPTS
jgi:lysine 2,3-aminomutase